MCGKNLSTCWRKRTKGTTNDDTHNHPRHSDMVRRRLYRLSPVRPRMTIGEPEQFNFFGWLVLCLFAMAFAAVAAYAICWFSQCP